MTERSETEIICYKTVFCDDSVAYVLQRHNNIVERMMHKNPYTFGDYTL